MAKVVPGVRSNKVMTIVAEPERHRKFLFRVDVEEAMLSIIFESVYCNCDVQIHYCTMYACTTLPRV